jgi:diguanylate cyclase (GGDEF)-like protein/PAS domain S-box-containing protein
MNPLLTKILVVDDDLVMRKLVSCFLSDKGYETATCNNADEAFSYLRDNHVDLIVLDHLMSPGISGLQMLKQLRNKNNYVGVVMLTGAEEHEVIVEAMQAGAQDFILKTGGSEFLLKLEQGVERALRVCLLEQKMREAHEALEHQAEFLQTVIDAVPTPIYYKDQNGRYVGCNNAMADFIQYDKSEIIGKSAEDLYENDLAQTVSALDEKLYQSGGHNLEELSFMRSDGLRHILLHKARFKEPGGSFGLVGAVVDITDRKLYENELRLAQTVFDTTSEAIVVTDAKNRIQAVNPSFTHVTGYSEEEVIGRDPGFLSSGRQDKSFYYKMWVQLSQKGHWHGEIWNRRKNGDLYAEWLSISAVYSDDGEIRQYVAVFSDITKRIKAEELIRHQANYDALTNLPNRNLFLDRLSRSMMRAKRNQSQVALMFLDLDRFKSVNDTLGHNIGDLLLQEAAERVSNCVRETDTVSRLGGDEFTVIIPDLHQVNDIEKIANKILHQLSQPFLLSGHEIFVSGSVGITVFPDDGDELETLLRNADTAMYRAKEAGRNDFRFFTKEMNAEAHQQMVLEREIRKAIENEEFIVYYQPVIDVQQGRIVSCEALVRWQHPTRGIVAPDYFIAIAEETGLIDEIGRLVLKQVCQQVEEWQQDPVMKDVRVAVNLSPHQLRNRNLVGDIQAILRLCNICASSIAFEITETLVMQDPEGTAKLLDEIRALGIKIYLDDFGTGYSSLNYLKRFSFDVLKIDRSFIMDVDHDAGDAALVEAIIVMAHKLGIRVVAEGVETENQRAFVTQQACDLIQGFYYSKPVDAHAVKDFCHKNFAETTEQERNV